MVWVPWWSIFCQIGLSISVRWKNRKKRRTGHASGSLKYHRDARLFSGLREMVDRRLRKLPLNVTSLTHLFAEYVILSLRILSTPWVIVLLQEASLFLVSAEEDSSQEALNSGLTKMERTVTWRILLVGKTLLASSAGGYGGGFVFEEDFEDERYGWKPWNCLETAAFFAWNGSFGDQRRDSMVLSSCRKFSTQCRLCQKESWKEYRLWSESMKAAACIYV